MYLIDFQCRYTCLPSPKLTLFSRFVLTRRFFAWFWFTFLIGSYEVFEFTRTWRTLALSMFFHCGGGEHPTMEDCKTDRELLESSCLKGGLAGLFSRFSQLRPECSGPGFSSVEVTSSSEKACLRGAFSLGSLEVAAKECGPPG